MSGYHLVIPSGPREGYTTVYYASTTPNLAQPFGALGGMPYLCEHFGLRINMARINIDYTLTALQNAHIVVVSKPVAAIPGDFDGVERSFDYLSASPHKAETLAQLLPNYNAKFLTSCSSSEVPDWCPQRRNGRFGAEYHEKLTAMHDSQKASHAFEQALFGTVPGTDTSAPTNVCAFGTIRFEKSNTCDWRTATVDECYAVLSFINDFSAVRSVTAAGELKTCTRGTKWLLEARMHEWDTAHAALSRTWRLDREANTDVLSGGKKSGGYSGVAPVPLPGTPINLMHLTSVAAHPSFPGAGTDTIADICRLADATGMFIMIEALPNDALPLYYAQKFGFQVIVWIGPPPTAAALPTQQTLDKARLSRQGHVHMMRKPKPASTGAGGAGAGASEEVQPPCAHEREADVEVFKTSVLPGCSAYNPRTVINKLHFLHLSVATQKYFQSLVAWQTKSAAVICHYATWAKEYARQVERKELTCPWPEPAASQEVEEEEAAPTRHTNDSGVSAISVTPPRRRGRRQPVQEEQEDGGEEEEHAAPSNTPETEKEDGDTHDTKRAKVDVGVQTVPAGPAFHFTGCTFNFYYTKA